MKRTVLCSAIALSVLAVTESSFFLDDKRPVGLPNIVRGKEYTLETVPSFVCLFDPITNTPFYSAYKVLPRQAANIGTWSRPPEVKWRDPKGT